MLLLYLISPNRTRLNSATFTFHYASTISKSEKWFVKMEQNLHSTMLLLYQQSENLKEKYDQNLHSTMLLLYHLWSQQMMWKLPIYIPLCFYYIDNHGWKIPPCLLFTFHYASTISEPERLHRGAAENLHSTMLLLYQVATPASSDAKSKFTFHYASTISTDATDLVPTNLDLHSTMLLLYPWWLLHATNG